jgi:hypothetical protein
MPVNQNTFIADVSAFVTDSLNWCRNESEKESTRILQALQDVMEDVKRRSKMSAAAERSLVAAQDQLAKIMGGNNDATLGELLGELQTLKSDHAEVSRLVNPVIEALQFQDRLVQNMQNLEKIIVHWFQFEATNDTKNETTELRERLITGLLKRVTTSEERDLIRKNFGVGNSEQRVARSA